MKIINITVFPLPRRVHNAAAATAAVKEAGACGVHTGRMNNEHTLFSRWAGSAQQTMSPSLPSSAVSDNDHIQQR